MSSLVNMILRAVTVLSAMIVVDLGSGMTMLGLGLACLSLSVFNNK